MITGERELAGPATAAVPRESPAPDAPPGREGLRHDLHRRGTWGRELTELLDHCPGRENWKRDEGPRRLLDSATRFADGHPSHSGATTFYGPGPWREATSRNESMAVAADSVGSPPVWSADGRQIVVSLNKNGRERAPWIFTTVRVNVDGTGRTE